MRVIWKYSVIPVKILYSHVGLKKNIVTLTLSTEKLLEKPFIRTTSRQTYKKTLEINT